MDVAPSMVQRSGDKLIVRRVVSGDQVHLSEQKPTVQSDDGESSDQQQLLDGWRRFSTDASNTLANYDEQLTDSEGTQPGPSLKAEDEHEQQLPQCKIKRNYSCSRCTYFTQNPRKYLTHLRDTHGEKIVINECKRCLYASRHYQKLVRHMKMVHGSVDGIRKSSFGSSRRRVQKSYGQVHLGQVLPTATSKLSREEANQLTTAYVQQLVASGLPKLLEEIEKSAAGASLAAASYSRDNQMIKVEMDQLKQSMPYSADETVQEANELDRLESNSSEDVIPVSKKRSRPIPKLIPLNMSMSVTSSSAPTQKFVKPIPLSALKAETCDNDRAADEYPLSLTKNQPQQSMTSVRHEDMVTKCMYCELSFKPVEALANHMKLAHRDDLIASLLANSFEEAPSDSKNIVRPSEAERTANEIWKRLLECSAESVQSNKIADYRSTAGGTSSKDTRPGSISNDETDEDNREEHQSQTYCGVETAPGYGEVTNRLPTIDPGGTGGGGTALMKKVFKCPHCSFWASTASRFHVHIVGHLNKKPFECSLCAYRSNWRWDITKHIRLKTIRDPNHKNAGVLMNDETGRRNYTKYNKYIALMQITDK
uniref:C2H2-type domain-containing protein n=1 Tax=Anopheles culicifacies TaxID=139723 RepID=A0A182MWM3_9DIPT